MSNVQQLAFVFPGQGSQKVGMLADLAGEPIVASTFSEASEALGYDLWQTIQEGPQEKLNLTETTQPALLASSVAMWRLWQDRAGPTPAWLAGHSLGEWSALVCGGVVDFVDAIRLVRSRGRYMQEAVPQGVGAMAAILGLDDTVVEEACQQASSAEFIVAPVNYNSPGQLVIAGHLQAVEAAMEKCKDAGAKRAMPLPVSAPFHTQLMKPAAERLATEIAATEFRAPEIPIVHNVNALPESSPEAIKSLMVEQIYSAVRWVECVSYLVSQGVGTTLECGPGKVLCGLNKRIERSLSATNIDSESSLAASLSSIQS